MNCVIHVYLLNEHFSPEHAKAHYNGEESENNQKYEWEDEMVVTSNVSDIEVLEQAVYPLSGQFGDGTSFSYDVAGMLIFRIRSTDAADVLVGASMSIVDSYAVKETEKGRVINLYLKDYEPMSNPVPGIYIASKEFPKELIF